MKSPICLSVLMSSLVMGAASLSAGEPGLVRFVYASDTFATLFHTDVWTKPGPAVETAKDVKLPEIKGFDMRQQIRLYSSDPGAEKAAANVARAFEDPPTVRVMP